MKNKRVRIGFVGVGTMGQAAHLRNYASSALAEECEVVALAEMRPGLAQTVAAHYGISKVYSSHEELLAKEELDGIVASQPFDRHGVLVPQLAKAGIPIFTEKPIANSIAGGERIIQALQKNETWLMVGYHKRSDPATIYAKNAIEEFKKSGEIGKMKYVRIAMPPGDWVAAGFDDLIRSKEPLEKLEAEPPPDDMDVQTAEDYKSFVNFYIHQVNLLRYLLGENFSVSYADPAKILFVAHSASGIPGVIEMASYSTETDWDESAMIGFERGYVKLGLPAPLAYNRAGTVEIYKSPGNKVAPTLTRPTMPWLHAMRSQAYNFIKAIRGEAPAPCLAPEALDDIKAARDYIRLLKGV